MNAKITKYILFFILAFVGFIEYQVSTLPIKSIEDMFSIWNESVTSFDVINPRIRAVINQQEALESSLSDETFQQEKDETAQHEFVVRFENAPKDGGIIFNPNPPIRYQRLWADYNDEKLDYDNERVFQEQLKRFETSLTDMGHVELESRIAVKLEQLTTGTVPGFEGFGRSKLNESDLLTTDLETLSPRRRKIRERILRNTKEMSLMEMHAEYVGLFDGRFSNY